MPITEPNPFDSPNPPNPVQKRWTFGRIVARTLCVTFLILSLLPTVYIALVLYTHYVVLSEHPTASYRPLILVIAIPISVFTATVLGMIAAVFRDFGDDEGGELLAIAISASFFPVPLGFFGPFIVCYLTGSSLGS